MGGPSPPPAGRQGSDTGSSCGRHTASRCQSMSEGPSGPCSRQQYRYLAHYLHAEAGHGCHTMRSNICNTEMDSPTATSPRHTATYGACSPAGNNPSAGLTQPDPSPLRFVLRNLRLLPLYTHAPRLPRAPTANCCRSTRPQAHALTATHSQPQPRPPPPVCSRPPRGVGLLPLVHIHRDAVQLLQVG